MSAVFTPAEYFYFLGIRCGRREDAPRPEVRVRIRFPDGRLAEADESELGVSETWQEVDRQTSTVSIGGAEVERIDRIILQRQNGSKVTLKFNNPQGSSLE